MAQNNASIAEQFHEGRAQEFIIRRLIEQINTAIPVKVVAVHPSDAYAGLVDVLPLIAAVNTDGNVITPSTIYNLPFVRLQGGASAVILDPAPGDIGLAAFAQADISNVLATRDVSTPNTARRFSMGDGVYLGGILGATPTQYVRFQPNAGGIDIVSPTGTINLQTAGNVHVQAQTVIFDANVVFNKNVSSTKTGSGVNSFAAPISAPDAIINGVTQSTHKHTGVQTGGGTSGGPTN